MDLSQCLQGVQEGMDGGNAKTEGGEESQIVMVLKFKLKPVEADLTTTGLAI